MIKSISSYYAGLSPVQNLAAEQVEDFVRVSWHALAGATSYIVKREGVQVGTTASTTFDVTTLISEGVETVEYSVSPINDLGQSGVENSVSLDTYLATLETQPTAGTLSHNLTVTSGVYVDWGEGGAIVESTGAALLNTYAIAGTYNVKVYKNTFTFNTTVNRFSFALSKIGIYTQLVELQVRGSNICTGTTSDLANVTATIYLAGNTVFSGSISNLNASLNVLLLDSSAISVTGSIVNITASSLIRILGTNTLTGNLADLQSTVSFCDIRGNSSLTFSGTWNCANAFWFLRYENGLTSTEVDNLLIGMAADITSAINTPTIDLAGANGARTSASDAAVTYLQGLGFTVNTN